MFRRHSESCDKTSLVGHGSPVAGEIGSYPEELGSAELELDPNLTCIGCGAGFKERQIQIFRRHCSSCPLYDQETQRRRAESDARRRESDTEPNT